MPGLSGATGLGCRWHDGVRARCAVVLKFMLDSVIVIDTMKPKTDLDFYEKRLPDPAG